MIGHLWYGIAMKIHSPVSFVLWVLKRSAVLMALILIAAGSGVMILNYSGFCWDLERRWTRDGERFRWQGDDEQIRRTVNAVNKRGPTIQYREGWGKMTDPKPIPYRDYDDFVTQNPDCCKTIGRSEQKSIPPVNFWTSIHGFSAEVVELRYTARFRQTDGSILVIPNFTEYAVVSNCGSVNTAWPEY